MKFKSIKVYNVGEHIENLKLSNQSYVIAVNPKLAIIEGENGAIIINDEGCGNFFESTEDKYEFNLIQKGKVYLGRSDDVYTMTIKEIINNIPYEEMIITDFMDRWQYKMRIKDNLVEVLKHMKKIGLNSSKYCTKEYLEKNYEGKYI